MANINTRSAKTFSTQIYLLKADYYSRDACFSRLLDKECHQKHLKNFWLSIGQIVTLALICLKKYKARHLIICDISKGTSRFQTNRIFYILERSVCNQIGHVFPVFTRGQFWLRVLSLLASVSVSVCVCLSVCQSLACPCDNSGLVQARITKFGPPMQKTLVKVSIVLWTDRSWPSRSNLTWTSKFTPFWACLHHNSPPIQARITTFGPEVHNTLVKIPIVFGGNRLWPSRSNMT